jgi:hypothetical protein
MQVSAMLCDYAQVAEGKLFINGAGINTIGTPVLAPPYPVQISLALLVTIPWNATNQLHTLGVELVSEGEAGAPVERVTLGEGLPDGHDPADEGKIIAQFNVGRAPHMRPGDDTLMPLALPFVGIPLPRQGDYFFSITIDGTEQARLSFRVNVNPPEIVNNPGPGSATGW